ncbi:MAG: alternative ribosome rescue aminoacyl-tRNA hydrolase ArfB, partial [Oligoflexus sp.]
VNKVNSKAVLDWNVTESPSLPDDVRQRFLSRFRSKISTDGRIVIASDESRQQEANLRACYSKLREMLLAVAEPPKIRRATKPTRASQERRLNEKKSRAQVKRGRQSFDFD